MKITTRMYRDVFGRARLFWKCEDCGLEWRGDEARCPRCAERHWIGRIATYSGREVRANVGCDEARQWAAAWKRMAKRLRAYYSGQGDYLHEVAEARDAYKDLSAVYRCQRDSARRVARALYEAYRVNREFQLGSFADYHKWRANENARRVLREEAKK